MRPSLAERLAYLGNQKIRRDRGRSIAQDRECLAAVRLFRFREKPFQRDARVDDQAHRVPVFANQFLGGEKSRTGLAGGVNPSTT